MQKAIKAISFNLLMAEIDIGVLKTQTRRILKLKNEELRFKSIQGFNNLCALFDNSHKMDEEGFKDNDDFKYVFECVPLSYKCGDTLWVREPAKVESFDGQNIHFWHQATRSNEHSITLPDRFKENIPNWILKCQGVPNGCIKEMARTFIIITGLKVEKLTDISKEDALKEGVILSMQNEYIHHDTHIKECYKEAFEKLWESVNGRGSWMRDKDKYVVVYDLFKVVE